MVLFPCILPLLIVPLLFGTILLGRSPSSPIITFMALMTLKPLLASALWLGTVQLSVSPSWTHPIPNEILYSLPGFSLTIVIVWACRASLKGQSAGIVLTLLVLDTIRWGSTVLSQTIFQYSGSAFLLVLSISMPSVFAIVAWLLSRGIASASSG
jgi:hypothetical protein